MAIAVAPFRANPNARLPPIVDATHVPCRLFRDDVALGSVAPGTKFSPPITRLVAAHVAAVVASTQRTLAVFDVPESMSTTTTPCPRYPASCSVLALVRTLAYGK